MAETTNLRDNENRLIRLFKEFARESQIIVIASIAMLASLFSVIICAFALTASIESKVMANNIADDLILEKNRTTLYIVYVQELQSYMVQHGLEPPPLPEEN